MHSSYIHRKLILTTLLLICLCCSLDIALSAEDAPSMPGQVEVQNQILTAEEQAWIVAHPEIRVANETDWPPFDFTEGSQPRGYSIDSMRLVAQKTGLNIKFINGFSWAEMMTQFKNGEIDIFPAIFKTEERSKWIAFTKPYSENPTVLVIEKDNSAVKDLKSLYGKKIAVIPGYSITEELKREFPEINQVDVEDITDALLAVSTGKVDGFIGSLGPITYLSQNKYITNIRIAKEVFKDIRDRQKLHMAVLKENQILLNILQKGLDSIADEEEKQIYQKWFQLNFSDTEKDYRSFLTGSFAKQFIYLPPVILSLFLIVYLFMFKRLRLNKLLTFTFVIITSLAITVIATIAFQTAKKSLEAESFNKLTAVREIKSQQLQDYFKNIKNQVLTFSESQMTIEAMRAFAQGFKNIEHELQYTLETKEKNNSHLAIYYQEEFLRRLNPNLDKEMPLDMFFPKTGTTRILQDLYISHNPYRTGHKLNLDHAGDNNSYSSSHRKFHPSIRNYLVQFGYYDIFLVEPESGHIVYSVFKEVDYGTSLLDGPYKDTNIAKVFREANAAEKPDVTIIADFEPYYPSYNAAAAFIASPIFDGEEKIGILIFQMPVEKINAIMTNYLSWSDIGLGASGETYVVGPDFYLRNQSRFFIEDRANYLQVIKDVGMPTALIEKIINLDTTIGLQPVRTLGTQDAMAGNTGTSIFRDYRGIEVLSSYKPLQLADLQWVIMSEIDKDEAFSHVYFLRNVVFYCYLIMLALIIIIVFYFSNHITRPLIKLTEFANELAGHDFSQKRSSSKSEEIVSITKSTNEVGILAKTFLHMEKELELSVQNLMRTTASKERMESELNIGKEIQLHMLATKFPEQTEIDVYGTLMAAREVGGDWYDFFFIDEDHFCFGIGDVSGKGVPAALFMAVAQTLIKARAPLEKSTANVITHLNKELSIDNPNFMFATIFLCILNIRTGELLFTNAAHNPAYVINRDGEIQTVDSRHGLVVGPLADSTYKEETITLSSGDIFFLYTDGVTEAMDPEENLFTDKRLVAHLSGKANQPPLEIVQSTVKAVKEFEAGAEQADDITILAVTFNGSQQKTANIFEHTINGQLTEISTLSNHFEEYSKQQNISETNINKLKIVFEDLLSNIINYGLADQKEPSIKVTVENLKDKLNVTIIDTGIPFNPLDEIASPDTTLSLEERTVGGLGFHIVQNIVGNIHYERKEDRNILTFSKEINQA